MAMYKCKKCGFHWYSSATSFEFLKEKTCGKCDPQQGWMRCDGDLEMEDIVVDLDNDEIPMLRKESLS